MAGDWLSFEWRVSVALKIHQAPPPDAPYLALLDLHRGGQVRGNALYS